MKRNRAGRSLLAAGGLIPLLTLTACGPTGYQIASLVTDGISYIASGKSLTDHGLSLLANEDCAALRALKGEPVCGSRDDDMLTAQRKQELQTQMAEADTGEAIGSASAPDASSGKAPDAAPPAASGARSDERDDGDGLIPSNFHPLPPVKVVPIEPASITSPPRPENFRDVAMDALHPERPDTGPYQIAAALSPAENSTTKPFQESGWPGASARPGQGSVDRHWDWSGQRVTLNGY